MFNLERSIVKYTRQIHPENNDVLGRRAELKDHMFMVIEALVEDGMTETEAFDTLVSQMGKPLDLANENRKNDAWYRQVDDYFESIDERWREVWLIGFTIPYLFLSENFFPEILLGEVQVAIFFAAMFYLITRFAEKDNFWTQLAKKLSTK